MKRYVLLFDGDCTACSKVARLVQELAVDDLEVLAFRDPQVAEMLETAGMTVPDRPSLLVTEDDHLQILSGWSLRRRLAGAVGWRRSRPIMRLLVTEWRARLAREAKEPGPSRRRVVGAGVAGVAGLAVFPRSRPAQHQVGPEEAYGPANAADVRRALASSPVGRAVQTWGPVESQVIEVRDGAERVLVFTHHEHVGKARVITFVDNSADTRPDAPVSLSMGQSPHASNGIRFYTVDGVPLGDIVANANGSHEVLLVTQQRNTSQPVPGFSLRCWGLCMAAAKVVLSPGCDQACLDCFQLIGGAINCTHCAICAGGAQAIKCAKQCR